MTTIYQIHFSDNYDYSGVCAKMYDNREAAEKAVHWYNTHPTPDEPLRIRYYIVELDADDIVSEFVPPFSEEKYNQMMSECYPERYEEDDYPDDDYYPEPSEEELRKYEETERLANELQEAEAKWKEEQERKNSELIERAIELCKEMGMKS